MGYDVPDPRVDFVFDDGPFAGATMNASVALSPNAYFGIRQWLGQLGTGQDTDSLMAAAQEVARLFVQHARPTWNLQRDGEPIPPTVEGLLSLDLRLLWAIVNEWVGQFGKAPLPLPGASPTGNRAARRTSKRRGFTASS